MPTRRKIWLIAGLVTLAVVALLLWGFARYVPPRAARLLPPSDAVLYINGSPLRLSGQLSDLAPVERDPEYDQFVRETGFEFERDLDEIAFAIHAPSAPGAPTRFSEILIGRFDRDRALAYLRKTAAQVESHAGFEIFAIPREGRTLRVALLASNAAAASNADDPAAIRHMIDQSRGWASPFGGHPLVREHYRKVPIGSLAWAIAQVPADRRSPQAEFLPDAVARYAAGSLLVSSVRYTGTVNLRTEAFFAEEARAARVAENISTYLNLYRSIEQAIQPAGADPDVKAAFDSLEVEQRGSSAVLSARIPPRFFAKALAAAEAPAEAEPETPPVEEPAKKKPATKRGQKSNQP